VADIPGLDPAKGLRIVNGNRTTYSRLLTLLAEQYGDPAFLLHDLLGPGDHAAIRRFTHDLTASAGSAGATTVQQLASTLDNAVRLGALPQELDQHWTALRTARVELITQLQAALNTEGSQTPELEQTAPRCDGRGNPRRTPRRR